MPFLRVWDISQGGTNLQETFYNFSDDCFFMAQLQILECDSFLLDLHCSDALQSAKIYHFLVLKHNVYNKELDYVFRQYLHDI